MLLEEYRKWEKLYMDKYLEELRKSRTKIDIERLLAEINRMKRQFNDEEDIKLLHVATDDNQLDGECYFKLQMKNVELQMKNVKLQETNDKLQAIINAELQAIKVITAELQAINEHFRSRN